MLANASHTEIWSLLQSGNQQALLALYDRHYIGLLNYGIKLTGNRELTNDCITQILLRLWDTRERLPVVGNIRAYLLTCLRRELMVTIKKENNRASRNRLLRQNFPEAEMSYEDCLISLQTNTAIKEKLAKALDKLTEREKELLRLKFFEDLDYDEIALKCGITKRTAYNILHAAIKTLKAEFAQHPHLSIVYNRAMLLAGLVLLLA